MLIQWLKTFRERRRLGQRGLFRYHDGQRTRWGDPFLLWRALINHEKLDLASMGELADTGQEPATTIVVEACCEVFGVKRWSDATQAGLTDWEVLDLLDQLDKYLQGLKKNSNRTLISSEPTAEPPSTSAASPAETTSSSSASG